MIRRPARISAFERGFTQGLAKSPWHALNFGIREAVNDFKSKTFGINRNDVNRVCGCLAEEISSIMHPAQGVFLGNIYFSKQLTFSVVPIYERKYFEWIINPQNIFVYVSHISADNKSTQTGEFNKGYYEITDSLVRKITDQKELDVFNDASFFSAGDLGLKFTVDSDWQITCEPVEVEWH